MESFHIYLPSNASTDHFPNNTASHFKTRLNKPIQLTGSWEVGVESVYYNAEIGDKDHVCRFAIETVKEDKVPVNNLYPYTFKVTKDGKWNYDAVLPTESIVNRATLWGVKPICDVLNMMNEQLLAVKGKAIFKFFVHKGTVYYRAATDGVSIELTPKMARYLGFAWRNRFTSTYRKQHAKQESLKLKRDDFQVKVFDHNVVKIQTTIEIKKVGEDFLTPEELMNRWKRDVTSLYKIKLVFKKGKVVIINNEPNLAITFNSGIAHFIKHKEPIISTGEHWGDYTYQRDPDFLIQQIRWYIDIYGNELETTSFFTPLGMRFEFYPRHFSNIESVVSHLNEKIVKQLKDKLLTYYDSEQYKCQFSFENNYIKFQVGSKIHFSCDKTLQLILGFDEWYFTAGSYMSSRSPATLDQREQHLYIHCNFINPVDYGTEKRFILADFLHNVAQQDGLVEKRFEPISYVPVNRSYIENMDIKLTNENHDPVKIGETKTIILLRFRKVR